MDDDTTAPNRTSPADMCRLVATDLDGNEADWAELVRAVFDGEVDPDAYRVTLQEPR